MRKSLGSTQGATASPGAEILREKSVDLLRVAGVARIDDGEGIERYVELLQATHRAMNLVEGRLRPRDARGTRRADASDRRC